MEDEADIYQTHILQAKKQMFIYHKCVLYMHKIDIYQRKRHAVGVKLVFTRETYSAGIKSTYTYIILFTETGWYMKIHISALYNNN